MTGNVRAMLPLPCLARSHHKSGAQSCGSHPMASQQTNDCEIVQPHLIDQLNYKIYIEQQNMIPSHE
jgi:hypothetical protein